MRIPPCYLRTLSCSLAGEQAKVGLAMQLVAMFQGSPDPYTAAAQFVGSMGGYGGGFGMGV